MCLYHFNHYITEHQLSGEPSTPKTATGLQISHLSRVVATLSFDWLFACRVKSSIESRLLS